MNHFIKGVTFIVILSLCSIYLFGQEAQHSADHYLDGASIERNNNFQLNLAAAVNGDASLMYERRFGESFSVSLGGGLLLPYYIYNVETSGFEFENHDPYSLKDREVGRSFIFQMKFYKSFIDQLEFYSGLGYRNRNFNAKSYQKVVFQDYTATLGAVHNVSGSGWFVDGNLAMGFRNIIIQHSDIEKTESNLQNFVTLNLSIGISF